MPYPQVTRRDVEAAIKLIDAEGIPHGRGSTRYSLVVHKPSGHKECYPPKLVLSYAVKAATGVALDPNDFSGGLHHTNRIFNRLGYEIEKTGPFLCIQSSQALEKLGKLEGRDWVRLQQAKGASLDQGFFLNLETFRILQSMTALPKSTTLGDIDPKAGLIAGATSAGYVVFPDGEIVLIGDTATDAQRRMAETMMQIV